MHVVQSRDDYHGKLWALAHCWRAVDGGAHDRTEVAEALNAEPCVLPQAVKDCALALGVLRRKRQSWTRDAISPVMWTEDREYYCHQRASEDWIAGTTTLDSRYISVYGHVDRDECIEHLERLLGYIAEQSRRDGGSSRRGCTCAVDLTVPRSGTCEHCGKHIAFTGVMPAPERAP